MAATRKLQVIGDGGILTIDALVKLVDQVVLAGAAGSHREVMKGLQGGGNFEVY